MLHGVDGTGVLLAPFLTVLPSHIRPQVVTYPPDQILSLAEYADLVCRKLPNDNIVPLVESFSGLVALTLLAEGFASIMAVMFVASFAESPRPYLPWV